MQGIKRYFLKYKSEWGLIIFYIAILVMMNFLFPFQEEEILDIPPKAGAEQMKFEHFRDGLVIFEFKKDSNNGKYCVTVYEKLPGFDMYKAGRSFTLKNSEEGSTAITNFLGRITVIEVREMKINIVDYGYEKNNVITLFILSNLVWIGIVYYKKWKSQQ